MHWDTVWQRDTCVIVRGLTLTVFDTTLWHLHDCQRLDTDIIWRYKTTWRLDAFMFVVSLTYWHCLTSWHDVVWHHVTLWHYDICVMVISIIWRHDTSVVSHSDSDIMTSRDIMWHCMTTWHLHDHDGRQRFTNKRQWHQPRWPDRVDVTTSARRDSAFYYPPSTVGHS